MILVQIMEGLTMEAKNSVSNLFTSSTVLLPEQKMKENEIRIQHGSEYAQGIVVSKKLPYPRGGG